MMRSKVFLLCTAVFVFLSGKISAQSAIDIYISEYSASNITGPTDNYGEHSDWIEIQSTHSGSVSLANHYLSNDPNDLYKWRFPNDFTLGTNQLKVVWLSGRDEVKSGHYHANFTLDQCKGQWLIISTSAGVPRDSIFVRPTQADHTRGRIDNKARGNEYNEWRVFTTHSFLQTNNKLDNYIDYAPKPDIFVSTEKDLSKPNKGGFYPGNRIIKIKMNGRDYDTLLYPCFSVFYTLSNYGLHSDYPKPGYPPTLPTKGYYDSLNDPFTIDQTTVVRAIAVQNPTAPCQGRYLPSFCETNTYFVEPTHQTISPDFGVVSVAFDQVDTNWFFAQGTRTIHVEYYNEKKQISEGYGIVTRPPQEKWLTQQKGYYITMDDRLGFGCGFEGQIFNVEGLGTSTRTLFPTLHMYAGDIESHSPPSGAQVAKSFGTGIRDVLIQSIAAKNNINVNPLHTKPVLGFKEGKFYGVYSLREVYDKHYEEFYNGQGSDSLTLNFVQNGFESHIGYFDQTVSAFAPKAWRNEVYDFVVTNNNPMNLKTNYDKLLQVIDKSNFIDYMIVNSFAVNQNLFHHDVAFAKGGNLNAPGGKWHFYLWNMPSSFSFTNITIPNQVPDFTMGRSPCYYYLRDIDAIQDGSYAFMGIGNVFRRLMRTLDNSGSAVGQFQLQFRNRYMDLINGPFSCEKLMEQFEYIRDLYAKEMVRHETPATGSFATEANAWKGNMDSLEKILATRCYINENAFNTSNCFGLTGPYPITIDVRPAGAGRVKLNTTVLEEYQWSGKYYSTTLSFKAIPTSTNYVFHHWEFQNHTPTLPASMDSVAIGFANSMGENVVAVFTDRTRDLSADGSDTNIPTGFTPNGDGINDVFRPLGAGEFLNNYEMVIFNRWGQEVFRSVDPQNGWNGDFRGQKALTGVYAYIISYRNVYGEDKIFKGNVTLTR